MATATATSITTPDINLTSIKCPHCRKSIKLTEAMAAPILESARAEFDKNLDAERSKIREEESINAQSKMRRELEDARKLLKDTQARISNEVGALEQQLSEKNARLAEAQKAQAAAIEKERMLADRERELELTIARQVNGKLSEIRQQAERDAQSAAALKVAEKDELITGLTRQIDELKRRAEQGDNRVQGEAQELVLESMLRSAFLHDSIEPVAKGVFGGDCLQRVVGPNGRPAGSILWESKRTKNWSDGWLSKLRDDQRAAKADIAMLVTQALPKGVENFDLIDGVWVADFRLALPMATILRNSLIEIAAVRSAGEGQETKAGLMYAYLTGPHFKQRVQGVVERLREMAEDLEKERTALNRIWTKREGQIRGAVLGMANMYGDLQGIAGKSIGEVEGLMLETGAGAGK